MIIEVADTLAGLIPQYSKRIVRAQSAYVVIDSSGETGQLLGAGHAGNL